MGGNRSEGPELGYGNNDANAHHPNWKRRGMHIVRYKASPPKAEIMAQARTQNAIESFASSLEASLWLMAK